MSVLSALDHCLQLSYDSNMTDLSMTESGDRLLDLWPVLNRFEEGMPVVHRWPIPRGIHVDGEVLRYEEVGDAWMRLPYVKAPSTKLLSGFLALSDVSDEAIERYARQWGVLGLCQHNRVFGHEHDPRLGSEPCRLQYEERLDFWRWYARLLRQLLGEGASLRESGKLRFRRKASARLERFVGQCYGVVLHLSGLRPMLVVEDGRFEIKLAGSCPETGLAAALATEFLFTVAGAAGIATCAACGKLFMPRRRPRAKEKSYCPECGIRAAWREAQRRRRRDN
jgi:predicted RNA-binding Zn-ribbon protein involved in translation (DUF1610 family)